MTDLIKIGVIGASGYTGSDLIRLLIKHPNVKLEYARRSKPTAYIPLFD